MKEKYTGVFISLQTPFFPSGEIDQQSLRREVDFCIRAGVHGLVVPVMAGEFFCLSDAERLFVSEVVVEQTAGRVPVMVGVQGVSKEHAVYFSKHAMQIGADSVIAMPPYTRPAPEAYIIEYFQAIDAVVDKPIMVQNLLAPLGTPLSAATLARLVEKVEHVTLIKEETRPPGLKISACLKAAPAKLWGIFGGANGLWLLNELERGACGTMPAAPFPDIVVKVWNLWQAGDRAGAQELQNRLLPVINLGSLYGNTFNKAVLQRRGIIADPFVRDPQKVMLDAIDLAEVEAGIKALEPYFSA